LLIVDTPAQQMLAREIVRQWNAVGIDVSVEAVSTTMFRDRIKRRSFTLALRTWTPGPDPDMFALWHSSQAAIGANEGGLNNQQIDRLIEGGRAALDADQRVEIYKALADRWAALLPSLPLYQSVLVYDLARDIQTTELEPSRLLATPGARFDGISAWTFPDR
jgi:peptide/nickel transport system substrate-binding protein